MFQQLYSPAEILVRIILSHMQVLTDMWSVKTKTGLEFKQDKTET